MRRAILILVTLLAAAEWSAAQEGDRRPKDLWTLRVQARELQAAALGLREDAEAGRHHFDPREQGALDRLREVERRAIELSRSLTTDQLSENTEPVAFDPNLANR